MSAVETETSWLPEPSPTPFVWTSDVGSRRHLQACGHYHRRDSRVRLATNEELRAKAPCRECVVELDLALRWTKEEFFRWLGHYGAGIVGVHDWHVDYFGYDEARSRDEGYCAQGSHSAEPGLPVYAVVTNNRSVGNISACSRHVHGAVMERMPQGACPDGEP